jgi:hypothetical protein
MLHCVKALNEVQMTQQLLQEWQTLYATGVSEAENGQVGTAIDEAEAAIKKRLEEKTETLEEAQLYSALRNLQRLRGLRQHE